jgi:hypothetical protein
MGEDVETLRITATLRPSADPETLSFWLAIRHERRRERGKGVFIFAIAKKS